MFLLTGTLEAMSATRPRPASPGWRPRESTVSRKTDYVVGDEAGSKRDDAKRLGVAVLDQSGFLELTAPGAAERGCALTPIILLLLAVLAAAAPDQAGLLDRLQDGATEERRAAAERLGEVGDAGAPAGLVEALRDSDPGVRGRAHDALCAIFHRSGDPAIHALLQQGIALMQVGRLPDRSRSSAT